MGIFARIRGTASGLAVTLATTGLGVLSTGVAAQAVPHVFTAPSVQIGYTDSARPTQAYDLAGNPSMPIGSYLDEAGVVHTSRVYATFGLTELAGKHIFASLLFFQETEVADCTKRAIEVWETHQIHSTPSWNGAPKATEKISEMGPTQTCPNNVRFNVDAAVAEAVRKGKEKISFEIRVPTGFEADPAYARRLHRRFGLSVEYNTVPGLNDHHMYHGAQRCDGTVPLLSGQARWLQGLATDADPDDQWRLTTEFAVWPTDDPSARREYRGANGFAGNVAGVTLPEADLQDGRAYSWQYRASDRTDTTPWSRVCEFLVDRTGPTRPTISSTNYPPAGTGQKTPLGEPGVFTFSGGGDPEIVGFQWGFDDLGVFGVCSMHSGDVGQHECPDPFSLPRTVRVNTPGGTSSALIFPNRPSTNRLLVRSIDRAGNVSEPAEYMFFAPSEGNPTATVVGQAEWGKPITLRLAPDPGISGTIRFEVQLDYGPVQVLEPGPDGTATFTFQAWNADGHQVSFRSFSANGWVSPQAWWFTSFYPWPTISSDVYTGSGELEGGVGVPGTFTFYPPAGWTEVKGYQYSINGGDPLYIDAGPEGTATVIWSPEASGTNFFDVWAVRPDGSVGYDPGSLWFNVA